MCKSLLRLNMVHAGPSVVERPCPDQWLAQGQMWHTHCAEADLGHCDVLTQYTWAAGGGGAV